MNNFDMHKKDEIWAAIARYLDNSGSEKDKTHIEHWLNEGKKNRQTFEALEKIWKSSALNKKDRMKEFLPEDDWKKVSNEIRRIKEVEKKQRVRHFSLIRKRQRFISSFLKVAALITVAFLSGYLTLLYAPHGEEQVYMPVINEIRTSAGEKANIQLGDGTEVALSADTQLSFPESFTNNSREVSLTGQAFFDVIPDENRPFIIHTRSGVIRVLGTSFDVRSYEEESSIDVMVTEGVVEISHTEVPQNKLIINRGYKGSISLSDNSLSVEWVDDHSQYTGWVEGRLVFKEQPLSSVFLQIERWYDVNITVDENSKSVLDKKFSANLKTRSVQDVMSLIEIVMNVSFEIDEDQIIVFKKGE